MGDPFEDTALVQGSRIPDGAYLVFRAYGPNNPNEEPACEAPFFTSAKISVTQAGVYRSGTAVAKSPGHVYWVETLYDAEGEVILEGSCGATGETTVVLERPTGTPVTPLPPAPPALPELPVTGGGSEWLPVWIGLAIVLIVTGGVLWFGRKLAIYRERNAAENEEVTIEQLLNESITSE